MKSKKITLLILLTILISSCKTHEKSMNSEKNTTEIKDKADYLVNPTSGSEKKETTDYEIVEIKQQGGTFLDLTVIPKLGCKQYSYEVISLPISSQGTKLQLELLLIQTCSEVVPEIKEKNIVRINLANFIPKETSEKTMQISFTTSAEKFNFNLVQ